VNRRVKGRGKFRMSSGTSQKINKKSQLMGDHRGKGLRKRGKKKVAGFYHNAGCVLQKGGARLITGIPSKKGVGRGGLAKGGSTLKASGIHLGKTKKARGNTSRETKVGEGKGLRLIGTQQNLERGVLPR